MELANFSLFPSIFPPMRVANYFFCAIPVRVLGPYFGGLFTHDLQEHHIVYGTTLYHLSYPTTSSPRNPLQLLTNITRVYPSKIAVQTIGDFQAHAY